MWTSTVDFTKAFDSISHKSIWEALKSCNIDHGYISLLRKIYRDQESNIFDIQKGSKQGDPLSSLLFNTVLQYSLKDEIQRWQKKKGMGIHLSDHDHDCLTNLRFADDVMLFETSKEQIRKMLCEFKKATEKVGLRIHPDKTKILSNQSTIISDTKKAPSSRWHEHRSIDKKRKREIFGSENLVLPTRNDRNQEPDQGGMGDLPQIQTRVDIKKLHAQTSSTAFRRHRLSDCLLRSGNLGTKQRIERMVQSTQRKMLRLIIQTKRKYKKIEKQDIGPKEENGKVTSRKCVAPMTKAEMVRAQRLRMTWIVKYHLKTMLTRKLIQL